ncbi:methylated-DNA--[protein]-cysteine S-methyltransferase [Paenibacillus nasutitermitis]|uniref:Methylated-DNA--protein-cysteine methyltransferase n=1 Tax=Paenibacillus nasutitermitis TaxID=1652958 RepID=A0A916ZC08_9BACL|nr:methylated-DNA--[protein]-cysteine S-methyltransferase [Paenibacillus nasutitermitis]GGD87607.1 methylated-DNA--protein-cysteine methyltransferase [Paenibacillus nasutitermitis]
MMHPTIYWTEMSSPIGPLVLMATDSGLCKIEFGGFAQREDKLRNWINSWFPKGTGIAQDQPAEHVILKEAEAQLKRYFAGELQIFTVKLDMRGTPFQTRVWQALLEVPYGESRSYKHIAGAIEQPKAVRAVGGANNRNPVPLIVPCHRIIGAGGAMVGYGGGLDIKTSLLELERQ